MTPLPEGLRPPLGRPSDQRLDADACPCSDCLESYERTSEPENFDVND